MNEVLFPDGRGLVKKVTADMAGGRKPAGNILTNPRDAFSVFKTLTIP